MNPSLSSSQVIGRYALTHTAELTPSGTYAATLSIRSGKGSSSHDRVFRFIPLFLTSAAAICYAIEQGKSYLQLPVLPA
ncbi:hypothetical protein [Comamonas sp. NoAH]|uniref:hypothetical protein n=1 Tax=Comamonas halotolerans TaxID=3041496 RepID=UPI0024E17AFB|nr:hypothetical protein [Comamonas sp. NoAH]